MLQRLAGLLAVAALTAACGQTDMGITTAVKAKLAADDTVKAYEINVTTQEGVVTLEGTVETSSARDRAVMLARETDGVREVNNRLTVGDTAATTGVGEETAGRAGEAVTDAGITTAVKAKLLADPDVSGLRIDVDTEAGVVTLTGRVSSQAEADAAVRLARSTDGVKHVVNKLTVGQ